MFTARFEGTELEGFGRSAAISGRRLSFDDPSKIFLNLYLKRFYNYIAIHIILQLNIILQFTNNFRDDKKSNVSICNILYVEMILSFYRGGRL